MIQVTEINGQKTYINPDLIVKIELVPDTILIMTTGRRYTVLEEPNAVIEKIVEFRSHCADTARRLRNS